jgi:HAD superfamily hydrolase (TIGR01509 family)
VGGEHARRHGTTLHVATIAAVRICALLFDFDGLILDTETAARAGWRWLYRQHGHELPDEKWALMVGTIGGWDPWGHLEELVGAPLERDSLDDRRVSHELTLLEAEELRPGIAAYLEAADINGMKRAIVSSGSRAWVDMHLARLERAVGWDAIVTADHDAARAKPRPTLYLEALDRLGVRAEEAVAFEDSPNGAAAAKAAGIYVVGVPNAVTRDLGLAGHADVVVESLAALPPDELFARFA